MVSVRIRRFVSENSIALGLSLILFGAVVLLSSVVYQQSHQAMQELLDDALRTSAALAAQQFTGEELDAITGQESMETELFISMVDRLKDIRSYVPNIQFAYIMRRTEDPMVLEFVSDADALSTFEEMDENGNGIIESQEQLSYPGDLYEVHDIPAMQQVAFEGPTVDSEITIDQWGQLISGYAPIYRTDGTVAGIIGLDMDAHDFVTISQNAFSTFAFLTMLSIGIVIVLLTFYIIIDRRRAARNTINQERSALLALATHQLGGPVSAIRWWVEVMKDDGICDSGSACGHIETSVEQINDIMQELISVEKQEHGKIIYKREPCKISALIEYAITHVSPKLSQVHTIDMEVDKTASVTIDMSLIGGVITELLENAMGYCEPGSTVHLSAKKEGNLLVVSVRDEGMGIDPREQQRIFEKLTRGSNAAKYQPNGTGLGLYVVKMIIDKARGSIGLDSTLGEGSTFTIKIPA